VSKYEEEFFAHFPTKQTKAFVDYATNEALSFSRYIFTERIGKIQYGYCTHCNSELFRTPGLKHGEKTTCPKCGSKCTAKASGRGRKTLVDEAYFVYYDKSAINPQAIVASGVYVIRDYRGDYRKVKTEFIPVAMYLFEPGKSEWTSRSAYYSHMCGECHVYGWEGHSSVYSLFNNGHMSRIANCYSRQSVREAVKGTPFAWSGWEQYRHEDMVKFFDLYARYPCIEYLTKLGFTGLVKDRLEGEKTYGAINWHGKNLFKVLKLTKQELNEIKTQRIYIDFWTLKIFQWGKKAGLNFTIMEAAQFARDYKEYDLSEMEKLFVYGNARKITGYLNKQLNKSGKHLISPGYALTYWRDYLADARKLGLDLTAENVIFPRDLYRAHQNTIKQIKYREDKLLNQKIKAREKELRKLYFEKDGLLIRAVKDSAELIAEGKALNHCVGGYANRHATGQCTILFIRKIDEPDKPYFTVEVIHNQVTQCRGKNNCAPPPNVKAFADEFKKKKLHRKAKNKISVPA